MSIGVGNQHIIIKDDSGNIVFEDCGIESVSIVKNKGIYINKSDGGFTYISSVYETVFNISKHE